MGKYPDLCPGAVIDGRARLVRLVGRGGMGEVWAAEHLTLGIEVAVKLLSESLAANEEMVARFSREAKAVAKIKSPNVVQIYDHGVHEHTPYIVMELLEGETVSARLEREQRMPPNEVVLVVNQACKALGQAHGIGIIHRDLKPANLFLTRVGNDTVLKVLDFGIVKLIGATSLTATGSAIGTASYMSPEQVTGAKTLDHRSDLFSLGVVTYRMLTGKLPFRGDSSINTMLAITEGKFVLPSQLRPELPAAIDAWISRVFARDANERFQSAQEFADALASALESGDTALGGAPTEVAPTLHSSAPPSATLSDERTLASRTEVAGFVAPVPVHASSPPAPVMSQPPPPRAATSAPRSSALVIGAIVVGLGLFAIAGLALGVRWWVANDSSGTAASPVPSVAPVNSIETAAPAPQPQPQPQPPDKAPAAAVEKPKSVAKPSSSAAAAQKTHPSKPRKEAPSFGY